MLLTPLYELTVQHVKRPYLKEAYARIFSRNLPSFVTIKPISTFQLMQKTRNTMVLFLPGCRKHLIEPFLLLLHPQSILANWDWHCAATNL